MHFGVFLAEFWQSFFYKKVTKIVVLNTANAVFSSTLKFDFYKNKVFFSILHHFLMLF
jgi:hypothetical protein